MTAAAVCCRGHAVLVAFGVAGLGTVLGALTRSPLLLIGAALALAGVVGLITPRAHHQAPH